MFKRLTQWFQHNVVSQQDDKPRALKKILKKPPFNDMRIHINEDDIQIDDRWSVEEKKGRVSEIDWVTCRSSAQERENPHLSTCLFFFAESTEQPLLSLHNFAQGFTEFEAWLCSQPNFDAALYQHCIEQGTEGEDILLWQRSRKSNYALSGMRRGGQNGMVQLQKGIYLEHVRYSATLLWRDYAYLSEFVHVEKTKQTHLNSSYKAFDYIIPKPTILGGLQVPYLKEVGESFKYKENLALPFKNWYVDIDIEHADTEIPQLVEHLSGYLGESYLIDDSSNDDDEEACICYEWRDGRVSVSLFGWFNETIKRYNQVTLRIEYQVDEAKVYDVAYLAELQQQYEQKHITTLESGMIFSHHYDYTDLYGRIGYTPDVISQKLTNGHTFFWQDKENNVFGIANDKHAILIDNSAIVELDLQFHYWRNEQWDNKLVFRVHDEFAKDIEDDRITLSIELADTDLENKDFDIKAVHDQLIQCVKEVAVTFGFNARTTEHNHYH